MAAPSETSALPIPWPENVEVKVYTGGCHCKKVRYEFEHPDIYTTPVTALNCNCSICVDRGYLNVMTLPSKFRFTTGSVDDLTEYQFGLKKVAHRFCSTCGTTIGPAAKSFVAVNTRTIDNVDLKRLQLMPVDGKSWPS
ncbi:Mss4-like protein [Mycena vulgaris]|nr:Mss4-like protein [Mycena vulgaris]